MNNLDDRKQWAPLHYAVDANNYYVFYQLTQGKTKFRCGKLSFIITSLYHISGFFFHLDININGGNGENVLHIAARSQSIWKDVSFTRKKMSNLYFHWTYSSIRKIVRSFLGTQSRKVPLQKVLHFLECEISKET